MNRKQLSWIVLAVLCIPLALILHKLILSCGSMQTTGSTSSDTARSEESTQPQEPQPGSRSEHRSATTAETTPDEFAADSEATLVQAARNELAENPQLALQHIQRADGLYGERNEDRRHLEIEVQVRLGKVGHARALADRFYRTFPESPKIADIERLTGYHPRPYGP